MAATRSGLIILLLLESSLAASVRNEPTFRAAVYEHTVLMPTACQLRICTRNEALEYLNLNLNIYEQQVNEAVSKGADIIVFPEDGLYGWVFTRSTLEPFLEYIPDPRLTKWNPCTDPDRFGGGNEVIVRLSCMARNAKIFVAANVGDRQLCNISLCPQNGMFFYNTDVLFDKHGLLIARYHKRHLFEGERFYWDAPLHVEYSFVDTSIGRLGFATCFDILFQEPAAELVEEHYIDTLLFPTAWTNVLPLFTAIGFHSAWAQGLEVNVLAANARNASIRRTGSGIYSRTGPLQFFHSDNPEERGVLVIADVPIRSKRSSVYSATNQFSIRRPKERFQADLFHDVFEFAPLKNTTQLEGTSICHNDLCCKLDYRFSESVSHNEPELFAVGAFDGMHYAEGKYYLQICVVLKCAASNDYSSCGSPVSSSTSSFDYLKLTGNHGTAHVFPEVVLSGPTLAPNQFHVENGELIIDGPTSEGLLTAALFGRWYERDPEI